MLQAPKRGTRPRRRSIQHTAPNGHFSIAGAATSGASCASLLSPTSSEELAPAPIPDAPEETSGSHDGWNGQEEGIWQRARDEFLLPTRDWIWARSLEWWLWTGIILLATILRFWGLGDKPLHHDESMHAYFSLIFAENPSSYSYNPLLHGPFQFHAEGLMFAFILGLQTIFVHGVSGNPWINDTTARIVPALFGIGIVALPLGLRRELGRYGARAAAFLLAVSPTFVYFSRFLREDIYFNFFMFAMVVSAVRFAHGRQLRWFVVLFASTVLAYATFEGIYLTLAIFGSFLAILLVWELALPIANLLPKELTYRERLFFSRTGLLALLGIIGGLIGVTALKIVNNLSNYINASQANQHHSDAVVANLENISVALLLYVSIVIALLVIGTLLWRMYYEDVQANLARIKAEEGEASFEPEVGSSRVETMDRILTAPSRWMRSIAERFDRERQPLLVAIFTTGWVYWFGAFVVSWIIFAALYWTIPGSIVSTWAEGFQQGIGHGIWQGLYYWIEQQNADRGGQPVYYYLLLIPLYEQLAVVFGLAGVVYSLIRPNRFRLFLVWWFLVSLILYSWAGEKMPWLSIHILLPLMLLAGMMVGLALEGTVEFVRRRQWRPAELDLGDLGADFPGGSRALQSWKLPATSIIGTVAAIILLIPMVHSMVILSHQDAADGPHEMMVYVQTTEDVDSVMNYINHADQVLYHGQHKLRIAVGVGEEWPYYWYLRDYPNTIFDYPAADSIYVQQHPIDVLLLLPSAAEYGSDGGNDAATFMLQHPTGYTQQTYKLRSWFDEGYKPLPPAHGAEPSAFLLYGDGLGNYLVYGGPLGSKVAPGTPINWFTEGPVAAGRLWAWLWNRTALGGVNGSYDFTMIVRNGMPMPLPSPLQESITP